MYKHIDLDTTLTLREFIELFNSEAENSFWDQHQLIVRDLDGNITDNWTDIQLINRPEIFIS